MNLAAQEAVWLRNYLMELKAGISGLKLQDLVDDTPSTDVHFHTLGATNLFCDNLGAVQSASNPASSKRSV